MPSVHSLPSKAALARHLVFTHMALLMDWREVATWDREELDAVHKRQHEAIEKAKETA